MEFRVEGRRTVGRPGRDKLESEEVDIAVLEINKEYVHDSKTRRSNVMKRKSYTIGKQ